MVDNNGKMDKVISGIKHEAKSTNTKDVIVPMNKRVLIEPESRVTKTKGGIIIPETANQKTPTKGKIIAISDDCFEFSVVDLDIGDNVLFSKFSGVEIFVPNEEGVGDRVLLLVKADDILAVIKKKEVK
jgi:chaperonin GroES